MELCFSNTNILKNKMLHIKKNVILVKTLSPARIACFICVIKFPINLLKVFLHFMHNYLETRRAGLRLSFFVFFFFFIIKLSAISNLLKPSTTPSLTMISHIEEMASNSLKFNPPIRLYNRKAASRIYVHRNFTQNENCTVLNKTIK